MNCTDFEVCLSKKDWFNFTAFIAVYATIQFTRLAAILNTIFKARTTGLEFSPAIITYQLKLSFAK